MLVDTLMPKIENTNLKTENFYEFTHIESVSSTAVYNKFLNWLSEEFVLYLQDWENELKIFFPSGYIHIELLENTPNTIVFKIIVKAKHEQKAANMYTKVCKLLHHLLKIY